MEWGSVDFRIVVAAACLVAIATWLHLVIWVRRLTFPLAYALIERVETADGSRIELRRLSPPRGTNGPPVLLVHGVAANHRNHDVHPDFSLARYLASRGRDVWLLTLRSGLPLRLSTLMKPVRFSSMVEHDVPLAIERVLARTGHTKLDYVGFSMGGMLLYAALSRSVDPNLLRRVVIIGSPGRIMAFMPVPRFLRRVPSWVVPRLPLRILSRLFAFASEWFRTPLHDIVVNSRNVSKGMTRLAMVNVIEDIPGPVLADLVRWAANDGEIVVNDEKALVPLADVAVPALFFAGAKDRLAPPLSVRHAFDAWGKGRDEVTKFFVLLGRSEGYLADYGHGDLAMGALVRAEMFEPLATFLESSDLSAFEISKTGSERKSKDLTQQTVEAAV